MKKKKFISEFKKALIEIKQGKTTNAKDFILSL